MSDKEFVDTNILVYAFDRTAAEKRERAVDLLARLWADRMGALSLQVLQEFYVAATQKLKMPQRTVTAQIQRFGKWTVHRPSVEDVLLAIEVHSAHRISFWDSLILRSAMSLGCQVLWSEDFNDGQHWNGLTVRNPFT